MSAARLSETIDEYLKSRATQGFAANTIRNDRNGLLKMLTVVGNIYIGNVTPRHIDQLFVEASQTMGDASLNVLQDGLSAFFGWCRMRGKMRRDHDPLEGRRRRRVLTRDRLRVPVGQFPQLLDSARHPRDRMVLSLGLYLFLRQGEIASLRTADVSLDNGEVSVVIDKSKIRDKMPVSIELDTELRRWLTFYAERAGPLDPAWYLCPAKRSYRPERGEHGRFVRYIEADVLHPERKMVKVEGIAQRALGECGYAVRQADGKSSWEGIHTLRRSGARALFDELQNRGYDGALRQVQSMLHHASVLTTEKYLGLDLDRKQRDDEIRGKHLFPSLAASEVATLRQHGAGDPSGVRPLRQEWA